MTESDRSAVPADASSDRSAAWLVALALAALSPALLLLALLLPWPWIPALVGRAHPVMLHFPIALLLLVAAMEAIEVASRGRFHFQSAFVLFAGSFGAVLAAACGFLLMRVDGVEGTRVERHLFGGIAVAALSVAALIVHRIRARGGRRGARMAYRALLAALCFALVLTGHDGSALTHGEDYLTEHLPWNAGKVPATPAPTFPTDLPVAQWAAYEHIVAPIMETRCVSCHNSTNFKGKLVLDNWAALARGGKTGPLWVAGEPSESLLVTRMLLPLDDEKHMPPKKKDQPTAAEIALLQLWVKAGAPSEGTPDALASDEAWLTAAQKLPTVLIAAHKLAAASADKSHEVDPAQVAKARALVERVVAPLRTRMPGVIHYQSRDTDELRINASLSAAAFGDAELAALSPLREWIVEMDLSDTAVTDASAPVLASMTRLRSLRLNGTAVTDATVSALAPLTRLESIGLFGTGVSDTAAQTLSKLPGLRRVYAAETKISAEALAALGKRDVGVEQ